MHFQLLLVGLLAATVMALPTGSSKLAKRSDLNLPSWTRDAEPDLNWLSDRAPNDDVWRRDVTDEGSLNPPPWRRDEPVDFYNPPQHDQEEQEVEKRRIPTAISGVEDEHTTGHKDSGKHRPWARDNTKQSSHSNKQTLELLNWDIVDPNDEAKGITDKPLELHAWDIADHNGAFKDSFQAGSGKKGGKMVKRTF